MSSLIISIYGLEILQSNIYHTNTQLAKIFIFHIFKNIHRAKVSNIDINLNY